MLPGPGRFPKMRARADWAAQVPKFAVNRWIPVMLQKIRSKTASIVAKALAGLLIISFAAWGVNDFIGQRISDVYVAKVGDIEIKPDHFETELQNETRRMQQAFGNALTPDQLRNFGLGAAVLDRLVNDAALTVTANKLGVAVGDDDIRRTIQRDPTFKGFDGNFSKQRFDEVMRANNLTEQAYVERVRHAIATDQVIGVVNNGAAVPNLLRDRMVGFRFERRSAETLLVKASAQTGIPAPTDAELDAYHKAHPKPFTAPEYRDLTLVHLDPAKLVDGVNVTEDEIKAAYGAHEQEFVRAERRTLRQLIVDEQAKADTAAKMLAEGRDFVEVAKEVAGMEAAAVDLGSVAKGDLLPDLADAAFSAEKGKPTAPVKSPLGWHIMLVTDVQPGLTKTIADVKDQLRGIVAKEKALDAVYKIANKFEDAIGGGATLEEAAKEVGMAVVTVKGVDREGKMASGGAAKFPDLASLLPVAYSTEKGLLSPLTEAGDRGFFMVRVDAVTAPALRPLADVKAQVAEAWSETKKDEKALAVAKDIAAKVAAGAPLADFAAQAGGEVKTVGPLVRSDNAVERTVVGKMFEIVPGKADVAKVAEGYDVVKLTKIEGADANAEAKQALVDRLKAQIIDDVAVQFMNATRDAVGVGINKRVYDAAQKPGGFRANSQS